MGEIKFYEALLDQAGHLQDCGLDVQAVRILKKLAAFAGMPADLVEEIHLRLARTYLRRHKYVRARRHLATVLLYGPENACYHYLMAIALDSGNKAQPDRAARHYRKSLQIDPEQADCLTDYGLLSLRLGQNREGFKALRRAAELAPDDADILARAAQGFWEFGRTSEARSLVRMGLFLHARDARFQQLYHDFEFSQARVKQAKARRAVRPPMPLKVRAMLLPFVLPEETPLLPGEKGKVIRHDGASALGSPHLPPRQVPRSDRKHG